MYFLFAIAHIGTLSQSSVHPKAPDLAKFGTVGQADCSFTMPRCALIRERRILLSITSILLDTDPK